MGKVRRFFSLLDNPFKKHKEPHGLSTAAPGTGQGGNASFQGQPRNDAVASSSELTAVPGPIASPRFNAHGTLCDGSPAESSSLRAVGGELSTPTSHGLKEENRPTVNSSMASEPAVLRLPDATTNSEPDMIPSEAPTAEFSESIPAVGDRPSSRTANGVRQGNSRTDAEAVVVGRAALPLPKAEPSSTTDETLLPASSTDSSESSDPIEGQGLSRMSSAASSLWDEAYDALRDGEQKDLVQHYEKIIAIELDKAKVKGKSLLQVEEAGKSAGAEIAVEVSPAAKERQVQMLLLVRARQDGSNKRSTAKNIAKAASHAIDTLYQTISSALATCPPAAVAFAGLSLLLGSGAASAKASVSNMDGLNYVVSRLGWYTDLNPRILRAEPGGVTDDSITRMQANIKGRIVKLYQALITYEMKSVCSYYRWRRLVTFLEDQADLNDWKGDTVAIQASETLLFGDVSVYNKELSLDLQERHANYSKTTSDAVTELVRLGQVQADLEQERQKRAAASEEEAARKVADELITKFCMQGLNYEEFKDRLNQKAERGTCKWFFGHQSYVSWKQGSAGVLVLAAPPGSGKSVLVRNLVDAAMKEENTDQIVCYFFFKNSSLQRDPEYALCAILHQFLCQKKQVALALRDLISVETAESLQHNRAKLWKIFSAAVQHMNDNERLLCFFDGLDECVEEGSRWLGDKIGGLVRDYPQAVKLMLASRPYDAVLAHFEFPSSHLVDFEAGNVELSLISDDIDRVIEFRLEKLQNRTRHAPSERVVGKLRKALTAVKQRTYLWVRLVFEILEQTWLQGESHWMNPVETLPLTVEEAYEELLQKVPSDEKDAIHELLSITIAAARTLSIDELREVHQQYRTLDGRPFAIVEPDDFKIWLMNTCGFVLQVYESKVLFIHETVREFLTAKPGPPAEGAVEGPTWKASVRLESAHRILAEASIAFLATPKFLDATELFIASGLGLPDRWQQPDSYSYQGGALTRLLDEIKAAHPLLAYTSEYWLGHFRHAQQVHDEFADTADSCQPQRELNFERGLVDVRESLRSSYLSLFQKSGVMSLVWWLQVEGDGSWREDWKEMSFPPIGVPQSLLYPTTTHYIMGAECSHLRLVLYGHALGQDINARTHRDWTALQIAILKSDTRIARWLLRCGASANLPGPRQKRFPVSVQLCKTAEMLDVLLSAGEKINAQDVDGGTALHTACSSTQLGSRMGPLYTNDQDVIRQTAEWVRILVNRGAEPDAADAHGRTPLHHLPLPEVAKVLVDCGAQINVQDAQGNTPLHLACKERRHHTYIKLLIALGADARAMNTRHETPLHFTVALAVAEELVKNGADRFVRESVSGKSPLWYYCESTKRSWLGRGDWPMQEYRLDSKVVAFLAGIAHEKDVEMVARSLGRDFPREPSKQEEAWFESGDVLEFMAQIIRSRGRPFRLSEDDLLNPLLQRDFNILFFTGLYKYLDFEKVDITQCDLFGKTLLQAALSQNLVRDDEQWYLKVTESDELWTSISTMLVGREPSSLFINGKPLLLCFLDICLERFNRSDLGWTDSRDLVYAVKKLCELLAPAHDGADKDGRTALHYLCQTTNFFLGELIWEYQIPEDMQDQVFRVFGWDHTVNVAPLLHVFTQRAMKPRMKDFQGATPFHYFMVTFKEKGEATRDEYQLKRFLEAFLADGKQASDQDEDGNTWLHELCQETFSGTPTHAMRYWFPWMAKALIDQGVPVDAQNNGGETVLHSLLAAQLGLLRQHNAIIGPVITIWDDERYRKDFEPTWFETFERMITALLEGGANPFIADAFGVSSLDLFVELFHLGFQPFDIVLKMLRDDPRVPRAFVERLAMDHKRLTTGNNWRPAEPPPPAAHLLVQLYSETREWELQHTRWCRPLRLIIQAWERYVPGTEDSEAGTEPEDAAEEGTEARKVLEKGIEQEERAEEETEHQEHCKEDPILLEKSATETERKKDRKEEAG